MLGALALVGIGIGGIFVWIAGSVLVTPANHPVGLPPDRLHAENVSFPSTSGTTVRGWFLPGQPGHGAVVLMHGVYADRRSLIPRAEFLSRAGYAVLLFDFQAHGASPGKLITFGYLESRDATAAVKFLHQKLPGEKVGIIGISLGAAAAQLADPPLPVNAMVLESSYPTIYQATEDRLAIRIGWLADLDTTIAEARSLFAAAAEPKQSWWIQGAGHVDLHAFARRDYEDRVLAFLAQYLGSN